MKFITLGIRNASQSVEMLTSFFVFLQVYLDPGSKAGDIIHGMLALSSPWGLEKEMLPVSLSFPSDMGQICMTSNDEIEGNHVVLRESILQKTRKTISHHPVSLKKADQNPVTWKAMHTLVPSERLDIRVNEI